MEARLFAELALKSTPDMAPCRAGGGAIVVFSADVCRDLVIKSQGCRKAGVYASKIRLEHGHSRKLVRIIIVHGALPNRCPILCHIATNSATQNITRIIPGVLARPAPLPASFGGSGHLVPIA